MAWPLPQIKVTLKKGVAYFLNQVNRYVLGYGDIGDCSMVQNFKEMLYCDNYNLRSALRFV